MGDRSKIEARREQIGRDIAADREGNPASVGVRCSFCSKSNNEVLCMIVGPGGVHICDQCIDVCAEHVAKRREGG